MLIFFSVIALFIAWIWVDYFRLIDIYEPESLKYFIITFILGGASVFVVFGFQLYIFPLFEFNITGNAWNDFWYIVIKIGAVEELAKMLPFVLVYVVFRNQINEPIDYLAYICVSALGFSAVENVMYFSRHGGGIINVRAILASVGHMADTAFIAYGIILYKYHPKKYGIWIVGLFFFFAALSHGIYDFWLIFEGSRGWGLFVTIAYFLVLISLFANILNNALNNSEFFTYKHIVDSHKVAKRLLIYYAIVFALQALCVFIITDFSAALFNFTWSVLTTGFIVTITCIRLSRFKLIKGKWEPLKFELPFRINWSNETRLSRSESMVIIKGYAFNEVYVNAYFKEFFIIKPLGEKSGVLKRQRLAYMERKIFMENQKTFYLVRLYSNDADGSFKHALIKPKTYGTIYKSEIYPIVGLRLIEDLEMLKTKPLLSKEFKFIEWAYLKPNTLHSPENHI